MNNDDLHQKGTNLRRQLLGEEGFKHASSVTYKHPAMKKFIDVGTVSVFGALWARTGLDLKTRALVVVVSDASTGRADELEIHLKMAMRLGWTEDEITEVLLQLMGYVGAPKIREAMQVAVRVFEGLAKE